jgi:hypothetical protein
MTYADVDSFFYDLIYPDLAPSPTTMVASYSTTFLENFQPPVYKRSYAGYFYDFSASGFNKSLYSGDSELQITLPRKYDDYGLDNTIGVGYEVEVVVPANNAEDVSIFTGRIDEITASVADSEGVSLSCYGKVTALQNDVYQTTANALKKTYSAQDPALVMRDLIDQFRLRNVTDIYYTTASIPTTSKTMSVELSSTTYLEAMNLVTKTAGANYYFFVDSNGLVTFKTIPTSATYTLMMGRDIQAIDVTTSIAQLKNQVLFWNGLPSSDGSYISKLYSRDSSVFRYGKALDRKNDQRFKAGAGGADAYATQIFNNFASPVVSARITVIDSLSVPGFSLESFKPGETVSLINISEESQLSDRNLITNVEYNIDYVTLDIVDTSTFINRSIFEIKEDLDQRTYTNDGPTTYTYQDA